MLWTYRRNNPGLTWADLTGEWPQPLWRTDLDLWYSSIYGEYQASRNPDGGASQSEIEAVKQERIAEMLRQQAEDANKGP